MSPKRPSPENKVSTGPSLSPPPTKRQKTSSTVTQKAVANFFAPASKKEPEHMTWRTVGGSLLVGKFNAAVARHIGKKTPKSQKAALFDFDSTLITAKSNNRFAKDAADWKWWAPSVPDTLKRLHSEGYHIAIISNQGGITIDSKSPKIQQKRLNDFKSKVLVVLSRLDLPISIYAATGKDHFRKPRTGMWQEFLRDYGLDPEDVDLEKSIFVGDAGGRQGTGKAGSVKDHACSDRDFADNVGIPFHTPEEYFLGEAPQAYERLFDPSSYVTNVMDTIETAVAKPTTFAKTNKIDIVLFCGSPGSGKSTFYWTNLKPLGYQRVNQDTLKTRDRCLKVASELLADSKSVVVDNTNADPETRALWTGLAKKYGVPIRCVLFTASARLCEHNDAVRALSGLTTAKADTAGAAANDKTNVLNPENRTLLPKVAFTSFASRYREPTLEEGFQDITRVDFKFEGDDAQKALWTKFWI